MKGFFRLLFLTLLCAGMSMRAADQVPDFTEEGYRIPQPHTELSFPRDHGNHPDYRIEWWYLTGHLLGPDSRRFGIQMTFFRFAAGSRAEADHIHMSHAAITDVDRRQFHFEERFLPAGWDAHAASEGLDLRNGNWRLTMTDPVEETMRLQMSVRAEWLLDLELRPSKPRVRFGLDGTSRKGADPAARSYYISFTRLHAEGSVRSGQGEVPVLGQVWMDHEIASQQLSEELAGWDWTGIQLDDGRELKAYILRKPDGTPDPFSAAIWIDREGRTTHFGADEFSWQAVDSWRSPATGATYPHTVDIRLIDPETGRRRTLRLDPLLDNQEIQGRTQTTQYWEGACRVLNEAGDTIGSAYLELVGYHAEGGA